MIERFRELQRPEACQRLRATLEPQVVEWRQATGEMASPEPHHDKFFPGGRWSAKGKFRHGFDAAGTLLILDTPYLVTLYLRTPGQVEENRYDYLGNLVFVRRYEYDGATLTRMLTQRANGREDRSYHSGGFLSERSDYQTLLFHERVWDGQVSHQEQVRFSFETGADGELERIVGGGRICWVRTRRGENLASVGKELEARLRELIAQKLPELQLDSPAYCLFLGYCSSGWDLAPELIVATEKERSTVAADEQYYPALVGQRYPLEVAQRWGFFHQLMSSAGKLDAGLKLLRKLAQELNGQTLPISTTTDFFVTAGDTSDGIDIEEDIRKSRPKAPNG